MIIQQTNKVNLKIYTCPICLRIYREQTDGPRISCLVLHEPGDCCHYGEQEIKPETLVSILGLLNV